MRDPLASGFISFLLLITGIAYWWVVTPSPFAFLSFLICLSSFPVAVFRLPKLRTIYPIIRPASYAAMAGMIVASSILSKPLLLIFLLPLLFSWFAGKRGDLAASFSTIAAQSVGLTYGNKFTDEVMILYYSALTSIHGGDPYVRLTGFRPWDIYLPYTTPTIYGTLVSSLQYPPISFLPYLPLALLHASPVWGLMLYGLIALAAAYKVAEHYDPRVLPGFLAIMAVFPVGPDYAWIGTLALSYYLLSRSKFASAGLLYGLSLGFKQFPLYVLPVIAYRVYRSGGRRSLDLFLSSSFGLFGLISLPFLLRAPISYVLGLAAPEVTPLLGVGFGLSQISYTGLYYLPPLFFTISEAIALLSMWVIYFLYYPKVPDATVPLVPLLLNYRVLFYPVYWMQLYFLSPSTWSYVQEIRTVELKGTVKAGVVLALMLPTLFAPVMHSDIQGQPLRIQVMGLQVQKGEITDVGVLITYLGGQKMPYEIRPQFRALYPMMDNVNGVILNPTTNVTLAAGSFTFTELKPAPEFNLPARYPIEIIAYYGQVQASVWILNSTYYTSNYKIGGHMSLSSLDLGE